MSEPLTFYYAYEQYHQGNLERFLSLFSLESDIAPPDPIASYAPFLWSRSSGRQYTYGRPHARTWSECMYVRTYVRAQVHNELSTGGARAYKDPDMDVN